MVLTAFFPFKALLFILAKPQLNKVYFPYYQIGKNEFY